MLKNMVGKGSLLVFGIFLFLGASILSAAPLLAQTLPPAGYQSPLMLGGTPVTDFTTLFTAFLGTLQSLIVILALVFIVIGALIYITSAGDEERVRWAKSAILAAAIGLALAIAAPLFLREIGTIMGWTTPTSVPGFGTTLTLTQVLGNTLSFLLALIGVIALIALVIGGFLYITSAGDADRADTGKKIATYAVIGLVVALAGLVIVTQVAKFFV